MGFSYELMQRAKQSLDLKSDSDLVELLPAMSKPSISQIKNEKRSLTEEQAMVIAKVCELDAQWVLVNLAAETTKSDSAKRVWSSLAKKLSSTALALALCIGFGLGCHSGAWSGTGKVSLLRRSRYLA